MAYFLDTSILIELRDGAPDIVKRVAEARGVVMMSVISRVELEGGVHRDPENSAIRLIRLDTILQTLPVLDFDKAAADVYRSIVAAVGYSRRKQPDRMIAAQALLHRATLVTRNISDFRDIPSLDVIEW